MKILTGTTFIRDIDLILTSRKDLDSFGLQCIFAYSCQAPAEELKKLIEEKNK